jgi:hypothetical protein
MSAVLPLAQAVAGRVGARAPDVLAQVLVAQAAVETGWQASGVPPAPGWRESHNLTGIADAKGTPRMFTAYSAWQDAEERALRLPYYAQVLAATDAETMCRRLGESPWAAGHYVGEAPYAWPGGSVYAVWRELFGAQAQAQAPSPAAPAAHEALEVEDVGGHLEVKWLPPAGGGGPPPAV